MQQQQAASPAPTPKGSAVKQRTDAQQQPTTPIASKAAPQQQQQWPPVQQQAQQQHKEPATPATNTAIGTLRNGSLIRPQQEEDEEEAWQTEAQRTTARAPRPPAANVAGEKSDAPEQTRIASLRTRPFPPLSTPSSQTAVAPVMAHAHAHVPAPLIVPKLDESLDRASRGSGSNSRSDSRTPTPAAAPTAAPALVRAHGQHTRYGKPVSTPTAAITPTTTAAAPASIPNSSRDPQPLGQQKLPQQGRTNLVREEQHALLPPQAPTRKTELPASVLAAGPQLAAAGLMSRPPAICTRPARASDAWEDEEECDEEQQQQQGGVMLQRSNAQQQQPRSNSHPPRHPHAPAHQRSASASDPAHEQRTTQQLRVYAPRSVASHSRGPSTPLTCAYSGRKR